ncbi:Peptidoglycan-binding Lysin subgroup [Corchorus olitorius]|uniref:Peptidoglycan-binding Lysin subgroup n=1 Tax=Corchorus olitorius TaxID=93759 RepID=A0A1R3JA43_9ROSI|nr:Peptidoglycan-binding Lysin subgroup [Corchorus olitorius]
MMLSKVEARKKIGEDSGNGKLLNEIEAISKALYLDKNASRTSLSTFNTRSKPPGKPNLPEPKSKLKNSNEDPLRKDKKSIWNWKPLKAFSNVKNRRFDCCFSLQVHSIENLPISFNDLSLCVHWKRRDGGLMTGPAKVFDGIVEFEEKLTHTCSVYGSRSGPHHSAKYEAKHFLLYASVFGAPDVDLGKHRVDLTRLLPLTLEELEEEKSSGKWTTSFKLSGKAKGATMNVSFGYMVVGDNPVASGDNQNGTNLSPVKQMGKTVTKVGQGIQKGSLKRVESLPTLSNIKSFGSPHFVEEIKDLHEVLPVSKSELNNTDMLDQKLHEDMSDASAASKLVSDVSTENFEPIKPPSSPESSKANIERETEDVDFSVVEKGIELSTEEQVMSEEVSVVAAISLVESPQVVETNPGMGPNCEECSQLHLSNEESESNQRDVLAVQDCNSDDIDQCSKESLMRDLELALDGISNLEAALDSSDPEDPEDDVENKADYGSDMMGRSLSLDDATESVASEFLNMLGIDHSPFGLSSESEPESPRERLLRQFEEETLASGCSLFNFDMAEGEGEELECGFDTSTVPGWGNLTEGFDLLSAIKDAEQEHQMETNGRSKTRAKVLEDMETEALMREWGLNEKAFQHSPPGSSAGFGSPVDLPPEGPLELPPLGEGLGPFMQTKNGGFVRSMNPTLFTNAKSGGSLIMQVSSPVVVPAEMGSGIMDVLQRLASVGIEKLSMQANKLMPLDDITGKTMQQVAWEAAPSLEGPERQSLLQHEFEVGQDIPSENKKVKRRSSLPSSNKISSASGNQVGLDYVSLEDLAPLAMDKIEALSMEGLRIQSGMSDEDAPSNISAKSIGEISALQGKGFGISGSLGLEGTAGLQLLDIKDSSDDVDGLMGLSLTLDEWMRLDSGDIDDEDQISERTSKILAAHHATSLNMIRGGSKGEKRRGRKCGLLGNNFTVALMVQLRDPLRNYEPVGAPMLSLIQVERVFVPPKPKIYSTVSALRNETQEDDDSESAVNKEVKEKETEEEKASQEEGIPQYRITEVHVAGLKTETGKKKLWGGTTQQQSGSRWLLANGMGKSNKHSLLKSKAPSKSSTPSNPSTTKVQPGDTLWSISSRVHGTGAKWKELAALNPHIRNPNVIFPNETIRLS